MAEYVGLEGVKGGTIKPRGKHFARTVTGFMGVLRKSRVCSSASDNGAVTVWKADDGTYHCDFGRWRSSINHQTFSSKARVRAWLKEYLPQMERGAAVRGGANNG